MYHYAGNNPIRYLDPDGRLIRIDDEGDSTFKSDVIESIEYLKQSEHGKLFIEALEKSKTEFTIKQCLWLNNYSTAESGDSYDSLKNTIYWNSRKTFLAANGNYNSPAICLMHEFAHAAVDETKIGKLLFNQFKIDYSNKLEDEKYDEPGEEFATMVENAVAKQLKECSGRQYYNDLYWVPNNMKNPTCFYSVQVTVKSPLIHSGSY